VSEDLATAAARPDRRRLLLDAAIHVFARKGYHACRVGDIAKEAGVSHGLLYHYFGSKEEVLRTIFLETWGQMLAAVRGIQEAGGPATDQVRKVAAVVLGSWKLNPDLIRLLVREVARSPHIQEEIDDIRQAMDELERIVRRGQERGELRTDLPPRLVAWILYGALEEILTGWVMGSPPADEAEIDLAAGTVVRVLCDGIRADGAGSAARPLPGS
jgi:TetR/AcrR family transcriptional regulator, fatty acid metabolism regulator protein